MPSFNILKKTELKKSFKTQSVLDMFSMDDSNLNQNFTGSIDIEGKDWNIGLIVGRSGTGKTTIAKECFGDDIVVNLQYGENAIIDEMPKNCNVQKITNMFSAVGFASPPSWLKPYHVLSNGEKMRVDLAKSLLEEKQRFAFDEFTSVVDRTVAQTTCLAISKSIKRENKQFIAITCHHDVKEWLEPDWVYDTDLNQFFFMQKNQLEQKYTSMFFKLKKNGGLKYGKPLKSFII
ncbi:MAG: hypothetical protein ACK5U7_08355 [Bacteroidota bacterium]|jgi:ABC-type ATPase with predicted acetyltransferase domain